MFGNRREFIKEFTVETRCAAQKIHQNAEEEGFLFDCVDKNLIKFSFTEKRSKKDIDKLIQFLKAYNE